MKERKKAIFFVVYFFEQGIPHFHSAFGLTNYVAALTTVTDEGSEL